MTYAERQAARNETLQEAADIIREWEPDIRPGSTGAVFIHRTQRALAEIVEGMKRS